MAQLSDHPSLVSQNKIVKGLHRQGAAEQISLKMCAAVRFQEAPLSLGFHAFGDNAQVETTAHADNRLDDGSGGLLDHQIADETLGDLELGERQLRQD